MTVDDLWKAQALLERREELMRAAQEWGWAEAIRWDWTEGTIGAPGREGRWHRLAMSADMKTAIAEVIEAETHAIEKGLRELGVDV